MVYLRFGNLVALMNNSSVPATTTTSMSTTEGALRLWREIVNGLQAAGYDRVVPEYLKLSQALAQVKMTELLKGQPEAAHWAEIRRLAVEALRSLGPLVEAAKVLAELPSDIRIDPAGKAAASSQPSRPEPLAVLTAVEDPGHSSRARGKAASSTTSSKVSQATRATPSSNSGQSQKSRAAVSKSARSGNPRKNVKRAKRRKHGD